MRRFVYMLVALAALALSGSAVAAGQHATRPQSTSTSSACTFEHPVSLTWRRVSGQTFGTLSWKPGAAASRYASYRVLRSGAVVGQTHGRSMRVNVSLGRRYRLRVWQVQPGGQVLACSRPVLTIHTTYRPPSAPQFPSASNASGPKVTISWQRAKAGDGPIVGYRVLRNRKVYGQTKRTRMVIPIASNSNYSFTVVAVDRNEHLSAPSKPVVLRTGHTPPPAVSALRGAAAGPTTVSLSWQPSVPARGKLEGYRVLRNGAPVGQYSATSVQMTNLTPSTTYTFTVYAVDSLGYLSSTGQSVSVRTAVPQPPSAPGALIGAALDSSTIELSWQSSQPAQGRIVGYRVLRNGTPVGQYTGTSVYLTNLFASTTYTFTVLAEDSLGDFSNSSATVTVRTADPTPTSGHVYAFLLASTGQSFQDFQAHYQEIGTVSPTYYDCDASADLTGANVALITQWAQARQVKVLPRFDCQRSAVLDEILNNQALEQQWINNIMTEVNNNHYDGATLDFEAGYPQDRDAYTAFVTTLAADLHAEGKTLMVAVSAKTADVPNHPRSTFFDYNALSAQADELFVMAWGIHWATSTSGAQDDMTWVTQVVNYIDTLPRINKYILGMQLYAMDWPNGGGSANPSTSYEYADTIALAAQYRATPTYNSSADAWTFSYTDPGGVYHDVWYTDSSTEANRVNLAHTSGLGGIGVWRLGHEDQRLWANPLFSGTW